MMSKYTSPKSVKTTTTKTIVNKKSKPRSKRWVKSSPFKSRDYIKMTYIYSGDISSGTTQDAFGTSPVWNLNNIREPITGQGSGSPLPQGYDEISSVYGNYKVMRAKASVKFHNPTQEGIVIGTFWKDSQDSNTLAGSSINSVSMKRGGNTYAMDDAGDNINYYRDFYVNKIEGITQSQMKNDISQYKGSFSDGPSKMPKLQIGCCNTASASNISVSYIMKIDYYVSLFNRKTLTLSQTP